jgi:hypothetical protein
MSLRAVTQDQPLVRKFLARSQQSSRLQHYDRTNPTPVIKAFFAGAVALP